MFETLQQALAEFRKTTSKKAWPALRLSCLRDHLGASLDAILARHRAGASGLEITAALTGRIDDLIGALYADALDEYHGQAPSDYAIIAQGGYGRGALNPKSDIDLLFLFRKKVEEGDPIRVPKYILCVTAINSLRVGLI